MKTDARYEGYLQTGRGCPFDCAYCAQASITNRKARFFPVDTVLAELDELLGYWSVTSSTSTTTPST